jgi:hypothetical protein
MDILLFCLLIVDFIKFLIDRFLLISIFWDKHDKTDI